MADEKRGWRHFQKLKFDRKQLAKRVKKAEGATMRHAHRFIVGRLDNMRDVRRHIIGWLLLVGVMIGLVGLQLMWFQKSYQTTTASSGGTFAEASLGSIDTLNPLYASSNAELTTSHLLFSSLYAYDTTGHLKGDLAKSITTDDTGTIYTVKIRSDAVWHDDQQLTANDIAFTVNLIKDPATRSSLRSSWLDIKIKVVDEQTIEFELPAAYAGFSHALTFAVLPEHILGKVEPGTIRENVFSKSPIGSGPFTFKLLQTIDTGQHRAVNMAAFEKYYGGAPRISRFEVHAYASQDLIVKALKSGQVNAAADLSSTDATLVNEKNYRISSHPTNSGVYALMNVDSPILKDKAVRKALQIGTDTDAIRSALDVKVSATGRTSDQVITNPKLDLPFISGQVTGADVPSAPEFNQKTANDMLDAAGWKLVNGTRRNAENQMLALNVTTTKNASYEKALGVLAGQWRQLGITINSNVIDTNDPTTNFVQNVLQSRSYDVLLYELSIGGDPDVYAYWHSSQAGSSGYNLSNYKDSIADASLTSARSRVDSDLRNIKYKAFAKQWLDDAPAIGLYQSTAQYAASTKVRAMAKDAVLISPQDRYANILYWSVNEESVYKTP